MTDAIKTRLTNPGFGLHHTECVFRDKDVPESMRCAVHTEREVAIVDAARLAELERCEEAVRYIADNLDDGSVANGVEANQICKRIVKGEDNAD